MEERNRCVLRDCSDQGMAQVCHADHFVQTGTVGRQSSHRQPCVRTAASEVPWYSASMAICGYQYKVLPKPPLGTLIIVTITLQKRLWPVKFLAQEPILK